MCGIRNTRTARATNDLRVTAGGNFLVVIVMWYNTRGSHDSGIEIVDPGFLFHSNNSLKIFRLISQESLSSSLKKRYIYIFLDEFDSRKSDSDLSIIVTLSPGVTLLNKSSHECGRCVLKSEKTFYLAIPFCFNETTKRLAAHGIELYGWNKFNIHTFPLQ